MQHKGTIAVVLALMIGSILLTVSTLNTRMSYDGADIELAMDTGEEAALTTESNTETASIVIEKDSLRFDMEQLISDTLEKREREDLEVALKMGQREKAERALQEKYQASRKQPQSIHGALILPKGLTRNDIGPIKLQVRTAGRYSRVAQTMLDRDGHYAFDPIEPGTYTLLVFETKGNPGINYRNIDVAENQVLPALDIPLASGVVTVYVVDKAGNGLSGARVTVGKTDRPSGSKRDFFTFRIGTSDADGRFVASNLTDGDYVVKASYGQIEASEVVVLRPANETEHTLSLRTSGSQIVGAVRRRDPLVDTSYPVILEGVDSDGNRVIRSLNSDSKGEYALSYLPPGTYRVYIQQTAQFSGTDAIVEIAEEKETRRNVDLDVYYAKELSSITGEVGNIGSSPGLMFHVLAKSQNGVLRSHAVVDGESGDFTVKALPPGHYTVLLMSTDANGRDANEVSSKSVIVEPNGSITRVEFGLPQKM